MNQLLKNFIPLGDTGSICYLQDTLKEFDSNDSALIQISLKELKSRKTQKVILLRSESNQINYESISSLLESNGFHASIYPPNSDFKKQVELFERILDVNKQGNVCILFCGISPALFEITIKLVLYLNSNSSIEELYSFLTGENPDIVTLNEFKNYNAFLENDPYLITKPDRIEFRKNVITPILLNGTNSVVAAEEQKINTAFTLNLSSLKASIPDNESLLTQKEAIQFNLNSLVETDFEHEESPEEHYQKIKNTIHTEVDDSLSLDVDLSEEIEYISSLESLSPPTMDKISVVNIDTIPLDTPNLKATTPTIDYKSKNYLDFDAMIEEEIEEGMLTDELVGQLKKENPIPFPEALNIDDVATNEKMDAFSFEDVVPHEDSMINLDAMETKANIDLSFPLPMQDLEDLLEEEIENEKGESTKYPVDPSQTFMAKRINDVIRKEVLNEDSKGKIYISEITKVNTENVEAVKENLNPTNPKISNPKFNPITLDD